MRAFAFPGDMTVELKLTDSEADLRHSVDSNITSRATAALALTSLGPLWLP